MLGFLLCFFQTFTAAVTDVNYHPSGSGNPAEKFNVFYPETGSAPFKTLVHFNYAGYDTTSRDTSIDSSKGLLWLALKNQFAVVSVSLTITNQLDSSSNVIPGRGTWKPYTSAEWLGTTGNYGQSIPEKDALWAVQRIHQLATSYGLDEYNFVTFGRSAGATMALVPAYFPERQGTQGFWSTGSSHVEACIAQAPHTWWPAYQTSVTGIHFPAGTDSTPYNGTPASTLAGATSSWKAKAGVLWYAFDIGFDSGCQRSSGNQRLFMYGNSPSTGLESTTFDQVSGAAYTTSCNVAINSSFITNTIGDLHSAWFGYTFKAQLEELGAQFGTGYNQMVVTSGVAVSGQYTQVIDDPDTSASGALPVAEKDWLLAL